MNKIQVSGQFLTFTTIVQDFTNVTKWKKGRRDRQRQDIYSFGTINEQPQTQII